MAEKSSKALSDDFSKIRNDHELFLEAYERPTHIYKFLKARNVAQPLFLNRNLSYMKCRKSRKRQMRTKKLVLRELSKHVDSKDLASVIQSDNHLQIVFNSLRKEGSTPPDVTDFFESSPSNGTQLMQVEVLLCRFRHLSEVLYSPQYSIPCSCESIGRTILQYDSKNGLTAPSGGSDKGSQTETSSGSITIPGSLLSWRSSKGAAIGVHMIVFKVTPIADFPILQQCAKRLRKRLVTMVANKSSLPRENGFKSPHMSLSVVPRGLSSGNKVMDLSLISEGKKALLINGAVSGGSAERSHLSPIRNGFVNCSHDKNWSPEKRQKKDAGIMTEISLGTSHVDCPCIFSDSGPEKEKQVNALDFPSSTHDSPSPVLGANKSAQTSTRDHTNHSQSLHHSSPQIAMASTSPASSSARIEATKLPIKHESVPSDDQCNGVTTVEEWKQAQAKASSKSVRGRPRKIPGGKKLPLASEEPTTEYIVSIPRQSLPEKHVAVDVSTDNMSLQAQQDHRHTKTQLPLNRDSSKDECTSHKQQLSLHSTKSIHSHLTGSTHVLGCSPHRITSPVNSIATLPTLSSSDSTSKSLLTNSRKRTRSYLTNPTDPVDVLESSPLAKRHAAHPPDDANPRGESNSFPQTSIPPSTPPTVPLMLVSDVYRAEFVVFDSRQQCQLVNGDYELLLQKCPSEERKMEDGMYTAWDTVFGTKFEAEPIEMLHLSFSLCWHGGPPESLFSDTQKTISDLCTLREEYLGSQAPSDTPAEKDGMDCATVADTNFSPMNKSTIFNFLYNKNSQHQTELNTGLVCPWCSLNCRELYPLLKHMSLCHPRFLFTYSPVDGVPNIDVRLNQMHEKNDFPLDPYEQMAWNNLSLKRKKLPTKCDPSTVVLVSRAAECTGDLSEFTAGKQFSAPKLNRLFFSSKSCVPLMQEEVDQNSEEDDIPDWLTKASMKMVDDFTDVNVGEKTFMKLWNTYMTKHRIIADKQIPKACLDFAQEYKLTLVKKNIVKNLFSHLVYLCDIDLVPPDLLVKVMASVTDQESPSSSWISDYYT